MQTFAQLVHQHKNNKVLEEGSPFRTSFFLGLYKIYDLININFFSRYLYKNMLKYGVRGDKWVENICIFRRKWLDTYE